MSGDKDLGGEIMVMVEEYASVMRVVAITGEYGKLMTIRDGILKRVERLEELARDSKNFGKDKGG